MDSYREHPDDFDTGMSIEASSSATDATSVIGTDERRMHVRAYNYWASLLGNRDFPSIEDLELAEDAGSGCCFNWWIRTEGCGNVQYRSYMTWPRIHNFDADTGAKIGYARQDDIDYDFGGCTHYGFVAGELLRDCPTATESICSR